MTPESHCSQEQGTERVRPLPARHAVQRKSEAGGNGHAARLEEGVVPEPDEFAKLLTCLVEGNQAWAKSAPVLALGCTALTFTRNGQPNAAALHDLGLASANLVLEATARGLAVHQMIGILPDRAREVYQVPEGVRPLTGLAIGYAGDPAALPEHLRARDAARRPRKPLHAFVFEGRWGTPAPLVS